MKRILLSWSSGKDSAWTLHMLRQQAGARVVGLLTTFNEAADRVAMHAVLLQLGGPHATGRALCGTAVRRGAVGRTAGRCRSLWRTGRVPHVLLGRADVPGPGSRASGRVRPAGRVPLRRPVRWAGSAWIRPAILT